MSDETEGFLNEDYENISAGLNPEYGSHYKNNKDIPLTIEESVALYKEKFK